MLLSAPSLMAEGPAMALAPETRTKACSWARSEESLAVSTGTLGFFGAVCYVPRAFPRARDSSRSLAQGGAGHAAKELTPSAHPVSRVAPIIVLRFMRASL